MRFAEHRRRRGSVRLQRARAAAAERAAQGPARPERDPLAGQAGHLAEGDAGGCLTAGPTATPSSTSSSSSRTPRWPARRVRLLAVVAVRDGLRFLPGFLRNVAPQVDGIVALDDGSGDSSAELLAECGDVLEL